MFTYYHSKKNYFITTNTKVLTSTLDIQKDLSRIYGLPEYKNNVKKKIPLLESRSHIFLVRNPYNRVESFFNEKLRKKVKMVTDSSNPYRLKLHQEIFYKYASIVESDSLETKQKKLLEFSWEQYIKALPNVFHLDEHLRPQSQALQRRIKRWLPFNFSYDQIIHIEKNEEMKELSENFGIDISVQLNKTNPNEEIKWTGLRRQIINEIYYKDFINFNYIIITSLK